MPVTKRYPVPARTHRSENTIERSRFIATVGRADTVPDAQTFIGVVRGDFPDATHHCWAFVVGPPGDTSRVGASDAGEPRGTAGRPMLTVLLGSGVGNVAAVVTRYFGGTKLGKGGLVRAYSGTLKQALEGLPVEELVARVRLQVTVGFPLLASVRHILPEFEASIAAEEYSTDVVLTIVVPEDNVDAFQSALAGVTGGQAKASRL
jgi:uncharacterized YigZ family protein